jgi:uncharacterized protein (TIRG00374 family)
MLWHRVSASDEGRVAEVPGVVAAGEPAPPSSRRRKALIRVAQLVLSLGVIIGTFFVVLPRVADFRQVWRIVLSLSLWQYVILLLATVWNIVTYWPLVAAGLPGLTLGQAAVANQSSTSVAMTVPGGGAIAVGVSYAMFRSWGFPTTAIALATLVTGIWNTFIKLALPVVALGLLAWRHDDDPGLVSAAILGLVVMGFATVLLVLTLWSDRFARRIGVAFGKVVSAFGWKRGEGKSWADSAVGFRSQTIGLLRARWFYLTVTTIVSHMSVFLVLLLSVRYTGISVREVGTLRVFAVFAIVRLASAVPIVPGNIGLAELGYVAGLALAGADETAAVAAVLVFRMLTYYLQIPIGAVTYLLWRRNRNWRKTLPLGA